MDDFPIWVIVIFFIVVLSMLFQKKIHFSEKYLKQFRKVQLQGLLFLLGFLLIFIGIIIILLWMFELGLLLVAGGIFTISCYVVYFKKDRKELKEMYKKEEQEQLYGDEIIKEKARLQVRKELKKRKNE